MTSGFTKAGLALAALAVAAGTALPSTEADAQSSRPTVAKKAKKTAPTRPATEIARAAINQDASDAFILRVAEAIHSRNPIARMHMVLDLRANMAAMETIDRENLLRALSSLTLDIDAKGIVTYKSSSADILANHLLGRQVGVMILIYNKAADKTFFFNHTGRVLVRSGRIDAATAEGALQIVNGQGFSQLAQRGVLEDVADRRIPMQTLMPRTRDADYFAVPGAVLSGKRFPLVTPVMRGAVKIWGAQDGAYPDAREAMTIHRDGTVKGAQAGNAFNETFIDFNDAPARMMGDFTRVLKDMSDKDLAETIAIIAAMSDTDTRMQATIKGLIEGLRAEIKAGEQGRDIVEKQDPSKILEIAKRIVKDYGRDFGLGGVTMPFKNAWVFIQPNDSSVRLAWAEARLEVGAPMAAIVSAAVMERVCNVGHVSGLSAARACAYLTAYSQPNNVEGRKALDAMVATRALEGLYYQTIKLKVGTTSIEAVNNAGRDPGSLIRDLVPTLHAIYLARSLGVPAGYDDAISRARRVQEALQTRTHLEIRRPYDAALGGIAAELIPLFTAGDMTDFQKLEKYLKYAADTSGNADMKLLYHLVLVAQRKVELGQGATAPSLESLYGPKPLTRLTDRETANFDQIRIAQKPDEVLASGVKLAGSDIPAGADATLYRKANEIIAGELRKAAIAAKGVRVLAPQGLKQ